MKRSFLDWNAALGTLIALAAFLLPVYLWQADSAAYSLTVRLVSSSALELPPDSKIHDMQIVVNGEKIDAPYVYSLVLINTGSKPIPSGNFETPLQIRTMNDGKLVTAQITGSEPADIPVKLSVEENQIKISPFLSNPEDQIAITLVSSGPLELTAQARISGVRDVVFEDTSQNKTRPLEATFFAVLAVPCLALYLFFLPTSRSRGAIKIVAAVRYLTTVVLFVSGVHFAARVSGELNYGGSSSVMVILPLFIIGWIIMVLLERKNRAEGPAS
ncbi:hypothetical protein [Pseudomonas sp. KK4]|uniref:hypothetical protein n=1 Tax=Pseudomonas sp. KK4 TaxID=1855729 RepID=UPI00097C52CC|nr:hypothetical protein [Pseudomonas sp. KK4]